MSKLNFFKVLVQNNINLKFFIDIFTMMTSVIKRVPPLIVNWIIIGYIIIAMIIIIFTKIDDASLSLDSCRFLDFCNSKNNEF